MTKKNTAVKSSSPEEFLSVRDRLLACETVKWVEGFSFVAGVDEAGRGCMAGP
ncbi:MAG TPA: ribonuclease HII, partial [Lentisphaeria bacterium]|nr:ribonuclease HII [Lentisphaeria bacterium]